MIDIKHFCGQFDEPSWLNNPFSMDGQTVATNGHLIIIKRTTDSEYRDLAKTGTGLESMRGRKLGIESCKTKKIEFELPQTLPKCGQCYGTKRSISRECKECDGEGMLSLGTSYNSYDVECKSCEGTKSEFVSGTGVFCSKCCSTGVGGHRGLRHIAILGCIVDSMFVRMIADLPGLQFGFNDSHDTNDMLIYHADDYLGGIMRMFGHES